MLFCQFYGILYPVMRDKNKAKTVKLRGPNGTTKEITAEEWAGYCPIAAFNNRMEEAIKFHKVRDRLAEDEAIEA